MSYAGIDLPLSSREAERRRELCRAVAGSLRLCALSFDAVASREDLSGFEDAVLGILQAGSLAVMAAHAYPYAKVGREDGAVS